MVLGEENFVETDAGWWVGGGGSLKDLVKKLQLLKTIINNMLNG